MQDGFVSVAAMTPEVRVADVTFNVESIIGRVDEACVEHGAKVVVLPELCVTGYTCEDLFWQDALLDAAEAGIAEIAARTAEYDALVILGAPVRANAKLYNCAYRHLVRYRSRRGPQAQHPHLQRVLREPALCAWSYRYVHDRRGRSA